MSFQSSISGAVEKSAFGRFWENSCASDWIAFLIVTVGYIIVLVQEPFHRMFSLDDRRIQFPHAKTERVPLPLLFFYSIGVPILVFLFFTIFGHKKKRQKRWHHFHICVLGLSLSLMMTSFFTDLVKNRVGRARPDLLDRCKPKEDVPKHELVTWLVCTEQDHHTLHDGWRSFPSGHASFAFAGLGFCSLYLFGQLQAAGPRAKIWRVLIAVLPLLGALAIAISRTEDYRHDVYDVTSGSIIGLLITFYTYRRYFPSIMSLDSNEVYYPVDDHENPEFEILPGPTSPDLELQALEDEE